MKNYGFGEDQVKTTKGFPLSECVSDVSLESIEYIKDKTKKGDPYEAVLFTFTRPDGGRLKDRMFEVNESTIEPRGKMTLEETIKQAYVNFNSRLWHIANAYQVDRETLNGACSAVKNFKSLIANYSKVVMEDSAGKVAFCKTVRSKGGYINLPMFPTFMQPGDEECTLEWSDYERKMNKKNSKPAAKVVAQDEDLPDVEAVDDDDDDGFDDEDDWEDDI